MPFAEKFGVQPDIVNNIRKPPRIERPRPQVAHDLRFYLSDNLAPLFSQISAQVLERSAEISSGENHSSANDASRSMTCGRSSRYFSQRLLSAALGIVSSELELCPHLLDNPHLEPVAPPTASTMSRSGKSVALKKSACEDVSQFFASKASCDDELAPTSLGKSAAMQSSRWLNIEPTSLSTRGFDAGARFEVFTTAKPLGVSTMSSEGIARRRASATTSREHNILILLLSV